MGKKNSFKGSKKYGMKHVENPNGKIVKNSVYGQMKKNYSRNQRGK